MTCVISLITFPKTKYQFYLIILNLIYYNPRFSKYYSITFFSFLSV